MVKVSSRQPVNILLITADDLNCDSVGAFGCRVPDITPNIDRLACEGMRFTNAHVTIAVCMPSRQVLMTGRYPHRNGGEGFEPIDRGVPTLQEHLRAVGYINGIMGKVEHLAPQDKFCWDYLIRQAELGKGRSPELYHRYAKKFFELARKEQKPFFLMANSHDPHRPFAGSDQEKMMWGDDTPIFSRAISTEEAEIPGFLPDIPDVRREVAEYFTSVYRCDETVGEVLRALGESGYEENTLVMFLSDNGMAVPFSKTNCYLNSTKTPWIVRWPKKVSPGTVDDGHLISGIDFMPTILDAIGLAQVEGMDGFSFAPLLRGETQEGREYVFTEFHQTVIRNRYPMRCVQDRKYGYIFNFWSDGETIFRNESQEGRTFRAMVKAAEVDTEIATRVRLFQYRVREEFYDFECDPNALQNLISAPQYQCEIERLRMALLERMQRTGDPAFEAFKNRDMPDAIQRFMESQRQKASKQ